MAEWNGISTQAVYQHCCCCYSRAPSHFWPLALCIFPSQYLFIRCYPLLKLLIVSRILRANHLFSIKRCVVWIYADANEKHTHTHCNQQQQKPKHKWAKRTHGAVCTQRMNEWSRKNCPKGILWIRITFRRVLYIYNIHGASVSVGCFDFELNLLNCQPHCKNWTKCESNTNNSLFLALHFSIIVKFVSWDEIYTQQIVVWRA